MNKLNKKFHDHIGDLEGVSVVSVDKFTTVGSVPEYEFFLMWREGNIQQGIHLRVFMKREATIFNVFSTTVALERRGITLQEFVDTASAQLVNSFPGDVDGNIFMKPRTLKQRRLE